ncbi:sensor histidine kinase [Pelagibacterium lentulum]|uniref:C4-dicarboxylate transport sensor protein DctB n=1 Tax=Pelagibacterium lentulum TaxID=2029865 RepID=A0A916RLL9_9HYPH|nr:ATP-binding protein [Pelagibacterium lentulum]GGA60852.1 two-component sensor histidine kinase [Pelagibacterium lentulum]
MSLNAAHTIGERSRFNPQWLWLAAIACAVMVAIGTLGGTYFTRIYFNEAEARGQNTLRLAVAALRGQMARFERLPQLLADYDDIKLLVANPDDPDLVDEMNHYLKEVNELLESSDLYVMMPDGNTIVASNFDTDTSFVGGNFSYRPYFSNALAGGEGRFFALGTTSLKRGYYFGAPVWIDGVVEAVVVLKVDVDAIEDTWRGGDYEIIVTDPEGIIFMTGQPDWLFSGILPLTEERLARTAETRRYADAELRDLPVTRTHFQDHHELMEVEMQTGETREYLMLTEPMPEADWTVKVLLDTASARAQAVTTIVVLLLVVGLATMAAAIYLQRQARLRERMQMQHEARDQLERRVKERTAELATVNKQLEAEVAERRATEAALRQTQNDLVQAGKLAALGQMSAALSHEFNQPLAAARNYADNALVLIERGRVPEASNNVSRITALIDRMASISRHLRNFARKPNQKLAIVNLEDVVNDTLEIVDWHIRSSRVALEIDLGPKPIFIHCGPVRLQQVLVNILTNAVDTVAEQADRRVTLTASSDGDTVTIAVRDHGPGVPATLAERIFDPFFTTKGVGKGLGLGLSISYNIVKDFGGDLHVENHAEGGAIFTMTLRAAAIPQTFESLAEPAQ